MTVHKRLDEYMTKGHLVNVLIRHHGRYREFVTGTIIANESDCIVVQGEKKEYDDETVIDETIVLKSEILYITRSISFPKNLPDVK